MEKPIIGITMGDPAGIGPEISIKALQDKDVQAWCRPLLVGKSSVFKRALANLKVTDMEVRSITKMADAIFEPAILNCYETPGENEAYPQGEVTAASGNAAFQSVKKVIELAMADEIDGTVTNPLNKEALNLAGHKFAGHTEIYAHYTGTDRYSMMLAHDDFRVIHVSTHVSLAEACRRVKKARVLEVIRLSNTACQDVGIAKPRIAVAGLNPHAGEHGLFGREELDEIIPAIEVAQREGVDVTGPIPPDTVFPKAIGGMYDIVVCMYHDQGHIPLKVVGFVYDRKKQEWQDVSGVNITIGLPIIRSSVDHGTAFDIAGLGIASPTSLINSIDYAVKMANARKRRKAAASV